MPMTAFITGITGQDGSYLAEFLLGLGYEVHGVVRPDESSRHDRILHIRSALTLHRFNLLDSAAWNAVMRDVRPTELYHLAATSFVPVSWQQPLLSCEVTGLSTLRILEAIRMSNRDIRFYQAGSSEMFGQADRSPQNESTPFRPRNPYAVAKVFAQQITANYREHFGIHACTGILYNHESPRRSPDFVTRKITRAAAAIKLGLMDRLELGNLETRRDWGFAGDYVRSMWLMTQQDEPRDFVIGTGVATSVREFTQMAFEYVGLDSQRFVSVDPQFYRPSEQRILVADPTQAERDLGWVATTSIRQLVWAMVEHDLQDLSSDLHGKTTRIAA